jgi:hypothetical protein
VVSVSNSIDRGPGGRSVTVCEDGEFFQNYRPQSKGGNRLVRSRATGSTACELRLSNLIERMTRSPNMVTDA